MSYVYPQAADLDGQPIVGTRQCVALVQEYAGAPITTTSRQGERSLIRHQVGPLSSALRSTRTAPLP